MTKDHEIIKDGKYIGEYPVPIRMIADRVSMRGAKLESNDIEYIEGEVNKILSSQRQQDREQFRKMLDEQIAKI